MRFATFLLMVFLILSLSCQTSENHPVTPEKTEPSEKAITLKDPESHHQIIPRNQTQKTYSLTISSTESNSEISIINLDKSSKFINGMQLPPGMYLVHVSKSGYKPYKKWIHIEEQDLYIQAKLKRDHSFSSLKIEPDVSRAHIRILNIYPKYHDNMKLQNGKYHIEVSKNGYNVHREWIEILDEDIIVPVKMIDIRPRYSLRIRPNVANSHIQILNIQTVYHEKIRLLKGKYHIRVEHEGYKPYDSWIRIKGKDLALDIFLESNQVNSLSNM